MPIGARCPRCSAVYPFNFPYVEQTKDALDKLIAGNAQFVTTCAICGHRFRARAVNFLFWED